MPFTQYDELLSHAKENSYAVGAFNIFSLEFLHSILSTAEEERSPVLLQINPIHFHFTDLPSYIQYVKSLMGKCKVPAGLNLDHGANREILLQGIQAGFPSVMYDGSKLSLKENTQRTREIVDLFRPLNITVEAELGMLNDEGLELTKDTRNRLFTDPDTAAAFVSDTGVDALAVAIGNAHGFYKGDPKLDFDRLREIALKTSIPLVLHGGSGISNEDLQKAISLGISKINIYTEMSAASASKMKELTSQTDGPLDYPTMLKQAREAVKDVVREKIRIFGSANQA